MNIKEILNELPQNVIDDPIQRHYFFCKSSMGRQWLNMLKRASLEIPDCENCTRIDPENPPDLRDESRD